jgi:hypothetical protein
METREKAGETETGDIHIDISDREKEEDRREKRLAERV